MAQRKHPVSKKEDYDPTFFKKSLPQYPHMEISGGEMVSEHPKRRRWEDLPLVVPEHHPNPEILKAGSKVTFHGETLIRRQVDTGYTPKTSIREIQEVGTLFILNSLEDEELINDGAVFLYTYLNPEIPYEVVNYREYQEQNSDELMHKKTLFNRQFLRGGAPRL